MDEEAEIQTYGWTAIKVRDETKERISNLRKEGDSYNDIIERMLNYLEAKDPILSISAGDKLSVHMVEGSRLKLETKQGIYELDQSKDIADGSEIKEMKFSFPGSSLFIQRRVEFFRSSFYFKINSERWRMKINDNIWRDDLDPAQFSLYYQEVQRINSVDLWII